MPVHFRWLRPASSPLLTTPIGSRTASVCGAPPVPALGTCALSEADGPRHVTFRSLGNWFTCLLFVDLGRFRFLWAMGPLLRMRGTSVGAGVFLCVPMCECVRACLYPRRLFPVVPSDTAASEGRPHRKNQRLPPVKGCVFITRIPFIAKAFLQGFAIRTKTGVESQSRATHAHTGRLRAGRKTAERGRR